MRRLYLQVYATVIGILVLFTLLSSIAWMATHETPGESRMLEGLAGLVSERLPGAERPIEELRGSLEELGGQFGLHLAIRDSDGTLVAATGEPLPAPPSDRTRSGWIRSRGAGPALGLRLPDGRWLIAGQTRRGRHELRFSLAAIGLLAFAIAIGSYPVVRRLTRRLEKLQRQVDSLGAGDLATRVEVDGNDEVAELARSFNRAAERIQRLVNAQRDVLASASHELRTPLTRMRVAIELLGADARPELRERVASDISELDELIGELLLASRIDAEEELVQTEQVDLLALVAEEGARCEAEVEGDPVHVEGDPRMLRRLVRNLLENAKRYGAGRIQASVARLGPSGALLRVIDRGPGVPEAERERIFEPFYRPSGLREAADGGIGLGLALVRQIAQHHRGDARCLAREGGGTCFEITLQARSPSEFDSGA